MAGLHAGPLRELGQRAPGRLEHHPPALLRRRSRPGIPIDDQGNVDYLAPILADEESLPVDPTTDVPPGLPSTGATSRVGSRPTAT